MEIKKLPKHLKCHTSYYTSYDGVGGVSFMNKERYELCKKLIDEGTWNIDLVNGIVTGRRGGNGSPSGRGDLRLGVHVKGKYTSFKVCEIISVACGLDIIDKEVDHIDGNFMNNKPENLQPLDKSDNIKKHFSDNSSSYLVRNEQVWEGIQILTDLGMELKEMAEVMGVSRETILLIKKRHGAIKKYREREV